MSRQNDNPTITDRPRRTLSARLLVLLLSLCACLCSSCGSYSDQAQELEEYRLQMEGFFERISSLDERIRGIDPDSEDAEQQLLSAVDMMTSVISDTSVVEAPDVFPDAKELLGRAAQQMTASRKQYHAAFDGDVFDAEAFNEAEEYFKDCSSTLFTLAEYLQSIASE